jgi:hypothetical protein
MPALARGQENQPSIVNWFVTVNGILTDMYEVGFRIFDITAGLPGTQIFPTTPGDYEDVTNAPGKFGVGSYYAYDNTAGNGYTPGLAATVGTHRIEWRWKRSVASQYQAGFEDFEVLVESAGSSVDTYCSVQDIRDLGITVAMMSDEDVLAQIELWQMVLERVCRQWFNARSMVLSLDGTDSDTLFLGVPIISVEYLRMNGNDVDVDTDYFRVYNGRAGWPDHRRNPKISLVRSEDGNLYTRPVIHGQMKFRRGYQNQEIKGIFGFTEADGSVPKPIKRALCKLVYEKITKPLNPSLVPTLPPPPPPPTGPISEEETDDHRRKYAVASAKQAAPGILAGVTQDPEIQQILRLYRAPMGAATPAHWSIG